MLHCSNCDSDLTLIEKVTVSKRTLVYKEDARTGRSYWPASLVETTNTYYCPKCSSELTLNDEDLSKITQ
jgi:hypothetical protein